MFHPISLNVVRQALNWMGVPKPIRTRSYGKPFTFPSGNVSQAYMLVFNRGEIEKHSEQSIKCNADLNNFRNILHETFMDDIRAVEMSVDYERNEIQVLIATTHVRSGKHA